MKGGINHVKEKIKEKNNFNHSCNSYDGTAVCILRVGEKGTPSAAMPSSAPAKYTATDSVLSGEEGMSGLKYSDGFSAEIGVDYESLPEFNTEEYNAIVERGFVSPLSAPLSTFSIDVDTASYANVRRYLMNGGYVPLMRYALKR